MSTPEERKQNDLKVDFIIDQAAGTDKNAVEYLTLLSQALRTIDDIYDCQHVFASQAESRLKAAISAYGKENVKVL